ncbi:hypothetical protein GQ457_11G020450 [Hibiscus cannabinus]
MAMQLGVPISGPPIIAQNKEVVEITCLRYLRKVLEKTDYDGKHVKLTWLKIAFQLDGNSTDREVDCAVWAYILLLIGGILMPDKSSAMVRTQYLPFLSLSWKIGAYNWGSTILTFLYRKMCKAAKMSNVDGQALNADIGGCMVLWHHKKERKALEHKVTVEVQMLIDMAFEDTKNWCAVMSLIHFALVEIFYGNREARVIDAVVEQMVEVDGADELRQKLDLKWKKLGFSSILDRIHLRTTNRVGRPPETKPPLNIERQDMYGVANNHGHMWEYITSVMDISYLSSLLLSIGVGSAGPSMFTTPRRMNVEFGDDIDDEESGDVSGGVADDDDDNGERAAEARARRPLRCFFVYQKFHDLFKVLTQPHTMLILKRSGVNVVTSKPSSRHANMSSQHASIADKITRT